MTKGETVRLVVPDGRRYAGPGGNIGPGQTVVVAAGEAPALEARGYERLEALPAYEARLDERRGELAERLAERPAEPGAEDAEAEEKAKAEGVGSEGLPEDYTNYVVLHAIEVPAGEGQAAETLGPGQEIGMSAADAVQFLEAGMIREAEGTESKDKKKSEKKARRGELAEPETADDQGVKEKRGKRGGGKAETAVDQESRL